MDAASSRKYLKLFELYKFKYFDVDGYWSGPLPIKFTFCSKSLTCSASLKICQNLDILEEFNENGGSI